MMRISRQELRNKLRIKRTSLTKEKQETLSNEIAFHIIASDQFQSASKVAFYLAANSEANPAKVQSDSEASNKEFYLPVLSKSKDQGLLFAPLNSETQLLPNQFNILEPSCKLEEMITGDKLDLAILPLVGFDKNGNRLGMGGGYYDRSFAFKNLAPTSSIKPILIGYAYSFQEVDELESESWDVKLDYLATEKGLFKSPK